MLFSAAMSAASIKLVIHRGDRVLPDEFFLRNFRAEVAGARAHVAVGQLEPRAGERVGELVGILQEAPRDFFVRRVEPQREVGGEHRRQALLRRIVRIGDRRCRRPWRPTAAHRPGSSVSSHSKPNRFSKKLLLHFVGVVVQVTSRPLVIVSPPSPVPKLFFQPRPCSSRPAASGSGRTLRRRGRRRGSCRRSGRRR